ncbi:glycosyltransferase family 9 protein [Desulfuromonas sp. KJ2020]|uniref:glycosyltransferase family 9 protein n=1 Tax=Desulfuromonas sp. KJ2020 TaxID=2919173 RepID=UPI0020A753EA|nr:glycosyltransferase family 9 protein [Desulfuromonas sp. KJ2020]MCP3177414.1 glycosyltransferase family 9 protein [Desulfuromonas sp. KJ2020]
MFVRPGGIGDAVHLVPSIQALKRAYPAATIDILAEKRNAAVFALCPQVNHLFHYDRPAEFFSVMRRRYDVIIDTEQWHRLSAIVARLIRSNFKIGFATNERQRMCTHPVEYSHDDYEMKSFAHLLAPLGLSCDMEIQSPFLVVPELAKARAQELLAPLTAPFVTLFPGASISERRWGTANFKSLAERLLHSGLNVVVVGGWEDRQAGTDIVIDGGLNLAGCTSLPETAAVLQRSALLVSGDSGVLHLAVGCGTPSVSLFGPGIATKWAPKGEHHRVINLGVDCSPCTRFGTTPPCLSGARCIKDISVDEVWSSVNHLLEGCSSSHLSERLS